MQTFLPYPEFGRCAQVLDERRLGKQRVEVLQILRALDLEEYGWQHHPAVRMWQGCVPALVTYGLACIRRWTALGHADATDHLMREFLERPPNADLPGGPPWLGWEPLHRSHRLALYGKDPEFYGARFADVRGAGATGASVYVWPDPPAPRHPLGDHSAWVVRAAGDGIEADVAVPTVPEGVRPGLKAARTVQRFLDQVQVGDLVVLPVGSPAAGPESRAPTLAEQPLKVGRVLTPARRSAAGSHHLRTVRWEGQRRRGDLRRPAQLQDPRPFFALYDEPDLSPASSPRP